MDTKPPIGIKPQWIWRLHRLEEITEAIKRYENNNKEIPNEWRLELSEHINWFIENEPEIFDRFVKNIGDEERA